MISYELYLLSPIGQRVAVITQFTRLQWSKRVNRRGALNISWAEEQYDPDWWALDRRVEVWRVEGSSARFVNAYFMRRPIKETLENGRKLITWWGYDANELLFWRIVAAQAGTPEARKTGPADDIMKEIVYEQAAGGAITARQYPKLSVQELSGLAPEVSRGFSRRRVLPVLQDIAADSTEEGVPLFFRIGHLENGSMQFQTFINQPGNNRTATHSPFSLARGTLAAPIYLEQDYSEEANSVFIGGAGEGIARLQTQITNLFAALKSPYNRREAFVDARDTNSIQVMLSRGRTHLHENRPRTRFEANLLNTGNSRFQVDWDFGDRIVAEYDEQLFECLVASVSGYVSEDAGEHIEARLEYVS